MCMLTFDYPQTYAVAGSTEEQLAQLRSYIWQLVDMLNQADDANEAGIGAADTAALRTELEKLRKALRDLEAKSGHGLPSGGTTGQALTKLSDRDYDTGWRTPKTYVDTITGVYTPKGSIAFASLPVPVAGKVGWVYNIKDAFTTDNNFVEGEGCDYPAGTNVVCAEISAGDYGWDVLAGTIDLTELTADEVQTLWNSI